MSKDNEEEITDGAAKTNAGDGAGIDGPSRYPMKPLHNPELAAVWDLKTTQTAPGRVTEMSDKLNYRTWRGIPRTAGSMMLRRQQILEIVSACLFEVGNRPNRLSW